MSARLASFRVQSSAALSLGAQFKQRVLHACGLRIPSQQLIDSHHEIISKARNARRQQAKHQPQCKFICQHAHTTELRHHALLITTPMEQI